MANEDATLTKKERREQKKQRKAEHKRQEEKQGAIKKWVTLGGAVIGILIGAYLFSNSIVIIPEDEKDKPADTIMANDWAKGDTTAPVLIMEYSDFQCSACKKYVSVLDDLQKKYAGQVVVVYRHFPLQQIHPHANLAAQAAEAAGIQGYFWEMHDLLFANQEEWIQDRGAKNLFIVYAGEIDGLDIDRFKQDLSSKDVRALVKADYMSGLGYNLNSTPSFFINGERVENPDGLAEFEALLQERFEITSGSTETTE